MLVIYLKDLLVEAKHGVHQREKETAQPFRFTVELTLATDAPAVSDKLGDTLDYSAVRRTVIDVAQNTSFDLIERLAQEIAARFLQDERVQKVVIAIDKPAVFEDGVPGIRLEVGRAAG